MEGGLGFLQLFTLGMGLVKTRLYDIHASRLEMVIKYTNTIPLDIHDGKQGFIARLRV